MKRANDLLYGRSSYFNGNEGHYSRSPIERGEAIFELFDYQGDEAVIFVGADLLHVVDDERSLSAIEAELMLSGAGQLAGQYDLERLGGRPLNRMLIDSRDYEASLARGRHYLASVSQGRYLAGGAVDEDVVESLSYLLILARSRRMPYRQTVDRILDQFISDKQIWKELDEAS